MSEKQPGTTLAAINVNIPSLAMNEAELMNALESSVYPGAQRESIKLVIGWCRANGKDPMKKPVHIVPMQVKQKNKGGNDEYVWRDVLMPGINDYRTDAARTNAYAGISGATFGDEKKLKYKDGNNEYEFAYPDWCEIKVCRIVDGQERWYSSSKVRFLETYATASKNSTEPNRMWKKRPYGQLEKCAEAMALRRAFPEVGAQNTPDEMEGRVLERDVTPEVPLIDDKTPPETKPELPALTDEHFKLTFPKYKKVILNNAGTAEEALAILSSKYTLTEAQKKEVLAVKPEPKAEGNADPADQAGPTRQQILDQIISAKDMDSLAIAADLIRTLTDEGAKAELDREYLAAKKRLEAVE